MRIFLRSHTHFYVLLLFLILLSGCSSSNSNDPPAPLLWYLRDELRLTGTKFGCGQGLCGTCTVQIDGEATCSCITPLQSVAGKKTVIIEGLSPTSDHPLQKAGQEENVPQCG